MTQWTPGLWEVARRAQVTIEAPAHCGPIAYMANRLDLPVSDSRVQATQEANARLIAAAPETVQGLRAIVQVLDGSQPMDPKGALFVAQTLLARL